VPSVLEIQKQVIERWYCQGLAERAVGAPELAVRFAPLSVLPHRHYVVFSRD